MKRTLLTGFLSLWISAQAFGQGAIFFNNRVPGEIDARVTLPDGTGAGAGWSAQLYAGAEGAAVAELKPVAAKTTFRTGSSLTLGYVNPIDAIVAGLPAGARATVVMRAFNGTSYENSTLRGESPPISITLGGELYPPASLTGLKGFTVGGPRFTITASAGANGSISPSGVVVKFKGQSQTFAATSDPNFTVDQWSVNERVAQSGGASYTLSNIQADGSVSVTFKSVTYDGVVVFNNHIVGAVEARVLLPDGRGAGAGWTAQLYGGPEGTHVSNLKPIRPTTTFRTTSEATLGYVQPVDVAVPGVPPGGNATLVMRVYNGSTFETSFVRGESEPITVPLGGGVFPPANLTGLKGFTLPAEPSPPPSSIGMVDFNNHIAGAVEARVTFPDGTGLGAGWTAQLLGGPEGGKLVPLLPTTKFRTASAATQGYVEPVVVSVPSVAPGAKATLVMVAFNGRTLETSTQSGQSKPITIVLGGGMFPPVNLTGLEGFVVAGQAPVIVSQPASQTILEGSTVSFNVVASGSQPLTYQWRFNDEALPGATASSLVIENVKPSHAGAYSVFVRSPAGSVTSAAARLTVTTPPANQTVADFNGDGLADLLFQNSEGYLAVWFMDGANMKSASYLTPNHVRDEKWRIVGTGRFNDDAHEDILFQHKEGTLAVWYMDGTKLTQGVFLDPMDPRDEDWRVVATGDFNRDGQKDLLFQHEDGTLGVWHMNGVKRVSAALLQPDHPGDNDWHVVGAGDFNSDGKTDLIFQHEDGTLGYWYLDGVRLAESGLLTPHDPRDKHWRVASVVDLNHDGKPDLAFQHKGEGSLAAWFMDGVKLKSGELLKPARAGGSWKLVAP